MTDHSFTLEAISPLELYGVNNKRFNLLKARFPTIRFVARGMQLALQGPEDELSSAKDTVEGLIGEIEKRGGISEERFAELIGGVEKGEKEGSEEGDDMEDYVLNGSRGTVIRARTAGQRKILQSSKKNDIIFALGPAGTGKTYMGVAIAVKALKEKQIRKIFLVRPAVEAGETLGFLPGDLKEKLDPYLRPLYDALEDMIHPDKLKAYLEKNIIEIAPLAYMRGRTLSNCYVILDEAQNTTENQFKMFLTRLGKGGKIIVTGDDSQIDLPRNQRSGLLQAVRLFKNIPGMDIIRLTVLDVVRHKLVKKIIEAYSKEERNPV